MGAAFGQYVFNSQKLCLSGCANKTYVIGGIKYKKIASLFLSVLMVLFMTSGSLVITPKEEDNNLLSIKDCYSAGKTWITATYHDDGTEISGIFPIRDLYENLNGYCINFQKNGEPNGYLVINADINATSHIREFSVSGNGIYDQLVEDGKLNATTVENAIYTTEPFSYAVKYNTLNSAQIYTNSGQTMELGVAQARFEKSTAIFNPIPSDEIQSASDSAFFEDSDLVGYDENQNKWIIPDGEFFSPRWMKNFWKTSIDEYNRGPNQNNCGPTAAVNICKFYHDCLGLTDMLYGGDVLETYAILVDEMGFDPETQEPISFKAVKDALMIYITNRPYSLTVTDLSNTWSKYQNAVNKGYPILIRIAYKNDSNKTVGHAMMGIGWRVLNDGSKYLRVADGWKSGTCRVIQWDAPSILKYEGISLYAR